MWLVPWSCLGNTSIPVSVGEQPLNNPLLGSEKIGQPGLHIDNPGRTQSKPSGSESPSERFWPAIVCSKHDESGPSAATLEVQARTDSKRAMGYIRNEILLRELSVWERVDHKFSMVLSRIGCWANEASIAIRVKVEARRGNHPTYMNS